MARPPITVLMGVYNGAAHLRDAVDSVLQQTFADFEFLIIDDGSTDASPALLDAYDDQRLRVVRNATNRGLCSTLNRGLELATGRYVARCDQDDVCEPERLATQFDFLEQHPDHVICASSHYLIDGGGRPLRRKIKDYDDTRMRWVAQFRTPLDHTTAMFRSGFDLRYDAACEPAEDYDLWLRLLRFGKGCSLRQPLMHYRYHDASVSRRLHQQQRRRLHAIAYRNFEHEWPLLATHRAGFRAFLDMYHLAHAAETKTIRLAATAVTALFDAFAERHSPDPATLRWQRRQAAGMLAEAMIGKGGALRRPSTTLQFMQSTWRQVPALALRVIEDLVER